MYKTTERLCALVLGLQSCVDKNEEMIVLPPDMFVTADSKLPAGKPRDSPDSPMSYRGRRLAGG